MMKKLLTVLLCVLILCTALAGCPRQAAEETQASETTAPTELVIEMTEEPKPYDGIELTFLSRWEETAPEASVLTQAAEVFEARTGAAVKLLWPGEGEQGDILQLSGVELPDYAQNLLDLTELAAAAGYAENSFSCLTDQVVSRCGFLGAIPQVPYVTGFYYNRETFQTSGIVQAPQNWERFLSMCDMLKSGGWQPMTLDSENAGDLFLMHLTQYLGSAEVERLVAEGGWQSEQVLQAVTDLIDFAAAGNMATGTPAAYPAGQNKIALSNSAFVFGTNALCAQVQETTQTALEWGMFPYPGADGAECVITVEADVLAVSTSCAEPRAAFEFIMLLTTGEFDQLRADLTCGIPADPGNESSVAGAVEALQITQVLEKNRVELTEKQQELIVKLWKGKYKTADTFLKEMDQLYSQT